MITEMQEKFCQYVGLYGFSPADAAKEAGYAGVDRTAFANIGRRLISNIHLSTRIAEIRENSFDVDKVRKSIILEHQATRFFRITDVMYPVTEKDDNGNEFTRIKVKPIEEWTEIARRMCVGFDKYNRPIFKSEEDAVKELTRIFGLYKDNQIKVEEDTSSVLSSAGLTPSFVEDNGISRSVSDDFDGAELDKEIGVAEESSGYTEDELLSGDFSE